MGLDRKVNKKWLPVFVGVWAVMGFFVWTLIDDVLYVIELKEAENKAQSDAMQVFNISRNTEFGENVAKAPINFTDGG